MEKAEVLFVSISAKKGRRKENQPKIKLIENYGIENDAHAGGDPLRQVSLLAIESIFKMQKQGVEVAPGDFAENITTRGINLMGLKIGDTLNIGPDVMLKITQLGKICHNPCAIYHQVGTCVMPTEGIFAAVVKGGEIRPKDEIIINRK